MDVVSKQRLLKFLQSLNAEKGVTIILTTHNLNDVEQVCPRIVILDHGKIALDTPREEILRRFGKRRRLVVQCLPLAAGSPGSGGSCFLVLVAGFEALPEHELIIRRGDTEKRETRRHGEKRDTETRRRGDAVTRRRGDAVTKRNRDKETGLFLIGGKITQC
jgi:ABC-type multidrug transport system ATPase subunit